MTARHHHPPRSTGGGQVAFLLAFGRALFAIAVVVLVLSSLARPG